VRGRRVHFEATQTHEFEQPWGLFDGGDDGGDGDGGDGGGDDGGDGVGDGVGGGSGGDDDHCHGNNNKNNQHSNSWSHLMSFMYRLKELIASATTGICTSERYVMDQTDRQKTQYVSRHTSHGTCTSKSNGTDEKKSIMNQERRYIKLPHASTCCEPKIVVMLNPNPDPSPLT